MKSSLKTIVKEMAIHKGTLIFALTAGIISALFKLSIPELFKMLIGDAWEKKNADLTVAIPLAIAGVWIISSVFRYLSSFNMKFVAEKIAVKLRKDLMDKYLDLNLSYLHNFMRGSGGLISRMINDISLIQHGLTHLVDLAREPITALGVIAYLAYLDWKLLIFLLVTLPVVTFVLSRLSKSLRKYSSLSMESMEDLTKTMKEALDGTRIVQSFNLQGKMRDRFDQQSQDFLKSRGKIISREEFAGPASETIFVLSLSAILIYVGQKIFGGHLKVEDFFAFQAALAMLGDAARKSQNAYVKLQQSVVAMDRYKEIIDEGGQVPEVSHPVEIPQNWTTLNYKNVNFSYDDGKPVLNGINLSVKRGEVVALVGSSGGGKSTLVNLLGRFFEPTGGEILLDNTPISEVSLEDYRNHVALVSQDVFLFSDTIEYNIHAGDFSKPKDNVSRAAKLANAHDFICNTKNGYQSLCGERGTLLSGGEKQRISIARAMLKDAPILILDEATSALDNESEKEVQKGLSELMKGRTTFVIAHRLSTIENADRILVMKEGQIVEQGTHAELMQKHGEYTRLQSV